MFQRSFPFGAFVAKFAYVAWLIVVGSIICVAVVNPFSCISTLHERRIYGCGHVHLFTLDETRNHDHGYVHQSVT